MRTDGKLAQAYIGWYFNRDRDARPTRCFAIYLFVPLYIIDSRKSINIEFTNNKIYPISHKFIHGSWNNYGSSTPHFERQDSVRIQAKTEGLGKSVLRPDILLCSPFSPRIVRILLTGRRGWRGRYKNALRGSGSGKGLNDEACCRVSTATAHNSVLHGPLRRKKKKRPPVPELLDAIASKWVPIHRATVRAQDQLYHTQRASRGLRFRLCFVAFKVAFEVAAPRLYPCPRVHRRLGYREGR